MYFTHPQFKNFSLKPFLRGFSEIDLRNKLSKIFPNYHITFTNSGRSAFQIAIKELCLENSEMILPAYICDIFKPILENFNIKPIYLDVDLNTFHADLFEIKSKITPNTKSILICHTYGNPMEMSGVLEIAKKYNLKVIEDCAHIAPPASPERSGDMLFFSFAKLFPVVNGGLLVSKNPLNIKLDNYKFKISNIVKFLRLFPIIAHWSEKFRTSFEKNLEITIPRKASKISLKLFNWYLKQNDNGNLIEYFHKKLKEIRIYSTGTTFISALITDRDKIFNRLREKGIYCSRIWHKPLYVNLLNTSKAMEQIINFPIQSWFTKDDVDKIINGILSSVD